MNSFAFSKSDICRLSTSEDSLGLTNPNADFLLPMAPLGCFQDTVLTVPLFWEEANNDHLLLALRTRADISVHPAIAAGGWLVVRHLGHK